MLKRMFALSNQGSRDLNKGIAATTLSNLCLIAPVSLLVMVIWELLNVISGQESSMRDHAALFICGTVVMFIIVFLTQWLQYNKTYTVAYKESANRRIVLAEKLRKLPLSFFGQRDLSDLTTTIMGDCTALERVFSNAIPQLFGTIFMFIITAIGLLVLDWRMGLCIVVPVPVAALVVFAAKKAQSNAESANMDAKRAAYLFVTALIALVAWIPYMYVMAKVPKAGVVLIMNLFVAIAFVAFGELANLLLGSLIVCSILAEIIRKWAGYKNYKGIVMSYILLSLSNIGSPLYVWVFSDYAISEASEEMSANYAEILSTLTSPWFMVLAIAATVVISIIVGVIAKKVYNKQFANAGIM